MSTKAFQIRLTDSERERLEACRAAMGFRSQADVIREWINAAPVENYQRGMPYRALTAKERSSLR